MTTESNPRRRRQIGPFGQLVVFMLTWAVLVTVFGVAAIMPSLYAAYVETGTMALPSSEDGADLGATSLTTFLIAASSVLATVLAIGLTHRFFHGPSLLDLGLRLRPGWMLDILIGLAL